METQTATRYKMLALDIDGTLLNRQREVSEQNQKWIQACSEAGVKVVLATSRPIQGATNLAATLKLNMPLIVSNSSEVWKTPDELYSRYEFDVETKKRFIELFQQFAGEIKFWVQFAGGQFDYTKWDPSNAYELGWLQVAIRTENSELLKKISEQVDSWGVSEISSSAKTNIECNPTGRNKGNGLLEICNMFGIGMDEVIAVGDSLNDIAMIRAAGLGIAMGNAKDAVKQAADEITLSNEEDGVAAVIKRYIFPELV